jgi:hypothetical protein
VNRETLEKKLVDALDGAHLTWTNHAEKLRLFKRILEPVLSELFAPPTEQEVEEFAEKIKKFSLAFHAREIVRTLLREIPRLSADAPSPRPRSRSCRADEMEIPTHGDHGGPLCCVTASYEDGTEIAFGSDVVRKADASAEKPIGIIPPVGAPLQETEPRIDVPGIKIASLEAENKRLIEQQETMCKEIARLNAALEDIQIAFSEYTEIRQGNTPSDELSEAKAKLAEQPSPAAIIAEAVEDYISTHPITSIPTKHYLRAFVDSVVENEKEKPAKKKKMVVWQRGDQFMLTENATHSDPTWTVHHTFEV